MLTVVYIYYAWIKNGMCRQTNVEKYVLLNNLLLSCVYSNINYFKQLDYNDA